MSNDDLIRQVAEMRREIAALKQRRTTRKTVTVTAVDPVTATFTADVPGAGTVSGIQSSSDFLPSVDDITDVDLEGAVPVHRPHRVTAEDNVSLQDLTVDGNPIFMGQAFTEFIDPKAQFHGGASFGSHTDPALTPAGGGEVGYYEITRECEAGHLYWLVSSNFWVRPSTSATTRIDVNVRYEVSATPGTDPPAVTSTSNLFHRAASAENTGSTLGHQVMVSKFFRYAGTYGHFRFLLCNASTGGQAYIEMGSAVHTNATLGVSIEPDQVQLMCLDLGPVEWTNLGATNTGAGTPAAVKTGTYTYYPLWSRRFTGTGAVHSNQSHAAQGQAPDNAANGNQASQFGDFRRDGTGASIATEMAGATIEKMWVYLYPRETGQANGLTGSIKYHTNTSAPGSLSGGAGTVVSVAGWKQAQGRWVEITQWASLFQAGTAKGIQIGPGVSTSAAYFGVFADHDDAHPPGIRVQWTK